MKIRRLQKKGFMKLTPADNVIKLFSFFADEEAK